MKKKGNINKNEVYACILACLIILWSIAGVLGTIAFFRTRKSSNSSTIKASAQTVTDMENRDRILITCATKQFIYTENFALTDDVDVTVFNFDIKFYFGNYTCGISQGASAPYECIGNGAFILDESYIDSESGVGAELTTVEVVYDCPDVTDFVAEEWVSIDYIVRGSFSPGTPSNTLNFTHFISFVDIEGFIYNFYYNFTYSLPNYSNGYIRFPFMNNYEFATENGFFENIVVAEGFATQDFLYYYHEAKDGYQSGYTKGYEEGNTAGLIKGESIGYDKGFNDANTYTFSNLLSAGFDVPIKAFTGLFNFDFLGVNLFNFFTALFTAALIIAVLRIFL